MPFGENSGDCCNKSKWWEMPNRRPNLQADEKSSLNERNAV